MVLLLSGAVLADDVERARRFRGNGLAVLAFLYCLFAMVRSKRVVAMLRPPPIIKHGQHSK